MAWESASWSLNGAANSLDILQSSLAEDGAYALKESQGHDGEPLLQQAAQVAQVNRLVLQGLDEARSRLEARAADAQEGPPKTLREALELAARLEQAITDDAYVSVVKDVLTNIRGFADKLAEYRASQLQERQMYAAMGERAGQVMARVDRSWEAQQQAMLHSLRTNSLLIVGAAVLALLVGLGAAFGISLLIVRPLRQAMGVAQRIAEGDLAVRVDSEAARRGWPTDGRDARHDRQPARYRQPVAGRRRADCRRFRGAVRRYHAHPPGNRQPAGGNRTGGHGDEPDGRHRP